MIYVAGAPHSGTTFVMELFHALGSRIAYWFNDEIRGGHEDGEFNLLAASLGGSMLFPFFGDLAGVAEEGVSQTPREPLSVETIREIFIRCWRNYDALKEVYGGHSLALGCALGFRPEVVLCVRNPEEVYEKYGGLLLALLPTRLQTPMAHYAVTGLLLTTCLHYGLPYRIAHFPRFVREVGYAWEVLGGLHGEDEATFHAAWKRSLR